MKKRALYIFLLFAYGCIPLRIAPNIETEKLIKTTRFKQDLPEGYGFVFEDPKEANAFYYFIDAKFTLAHTYLDSNIPFQINNQDYYLSFYEREKTTKTLNLVPLAIDAHRESKGRNSQFQDAYTNRKGRWYIILMVSDRSFNDCLNPKHPNYQDVIKYLQSLRKEYLSTHNYMETYLKRQ